MKGITKVLKVTKNRGGVVRETIILSSWRKQSLQTPPSGKNKYIQNQVNNKKKKKINKINLTQKQRSKQTPT